MMLELLVFGYVTGVTSGREIERHCPRDLAFTSPAVSGALEYRSIIRVSRRRLDALAPVVLQGLGWCAKAGLVGLGRVPLDTMQLLANASLARR